MEFDRVYPNDTNKILFNGGLNCKYSDNLIADNEAADCLNVIEDGYGVKTRYGSRPLNSVAPGSYACDGLYVRHDYDGNESMVAFFGGNAYVLGTSTFNTIPSAQSVFTAGVRMAGAEADGYLFVGNGGTPYKYNGTFTRHGIPAPTSTPAVVSQAAGVLTGDYTYKIAYVNSMGVEGNPGPSSTTYAAVNATLRVDLSVAPVSFGVNARNLYRIEAGGSTYKRVTQITNNTATVYDDNKADADLGATAPVDNNVPPNYDAIHWHGGLQRLFFTDSADRRFVKYTDVDANGVNPYCVKSLGYLTVGDKGADVPRGFVSIENALIILCDRRPYILYFPDNTPANWLLIPCRSHYGSNSPFALVEHNNGVLSTALENKIFVGFQHILGNALKPDVSLLTYSSVGGELISDKIEPLMLQVNNALTRNISAIVFKSQIYVTLPHGSTATYNNRIYVLDLSIIDIEKRFQDDMFGINSYSWYPWTGLNISQFVIYGGKLYGGCSDAVGLVHELNYSEYTDNGDPIDSYYVTKEFFGYMKDSDNHKDFRELYLLADSLRDSYLGIAAKSDSDEGVFSMRPYSISPGATYWGVDLWASSIWSAGKAQLDLTFDIGPLSGKRVQFKFSNQNKANQYFKLHYMAFSYNVKGRR